MYCEKSIIVISGLIASGKSYLLDILRKNTNTLCIDCDKEVRKIMSLKERKRIIKEKGLKYLEDKIYPILRNNILTEVTKTKFNIVAIEGIKAKELFKDIVDAELVCKAPEIVRKRRSLGRGDSLEKFNYFNKLQKEF